MSDTEPRSRSQSRRSRRRKAATSQKQSQPATIPEQDPPSSSEDDKAMQPFERIGPAATSMDGPVTYARAQRGEIPMRDGNAKQALATKGGEGQKSETSKMMEQDGLKLRLELNLDIEIELKASIHGDLTLALL